MVRIARLGCIAVLLLFMSGCASAHGPASSASSSATPSVPPSQTATSTEVSCLNPHPNDAHISTPIASRMIALSATRPTRVFTLSPQEAWAIGFSEVSGGTAGPDRPGPPVFLHYSGGQWHAITSPIDNELFGLFMVSATDGWAVGWRGAILHYDGARWLPVSSPTTATLLSVSMTSAEEGWAVGEGAALLHYTAGRWQQIPAPISCRYVTDQLTTLSSVTMTASGEGWAIGSLGWHGMILRCHLKVWSVFDRPAYGRLQGISLASPDDGWAVGINDRDNNSYILHYYHGTWSLQATPAGMAPTNVAMLSASDGWLVGGGQNVLAHYVNGQWRAINSGRDLYGGLISISLSTAQEGWAVGTHWLLHLHQGRWSVYV